MNYNNVTLRLQDARTGWKRWRLKQTRLWISFGKRLSDKARYGIMNELGWIAYIKRLSLLASSTPPILIYVLLHDEWNKPKKSITKITKKQDRHILLR